MSTPTIATAEDQAEISALIADGTAASGRRPLSDHPWLARIHDADRADLVARRDGTLVGYATVVPVNDGFTTEVVLAPAAPRDVDVATGLVHLARRAVAERGGGALNWWVADPHPWHREAAMAAGLMPRRVLLQMRRPLPADPPDPIELRTFRPGDEVALVEVNNRAFADHPEQGGWTGDTLASRLAEHWFDPDGIVIHEIDGRMAGFCWTKLHPAIGADPPIGEIYVIGVDPRYQGRGLGRALTLAGLESIHANGVDVGQLYVDSANAVAVAMYERLGFTTTRIDESFGITVHGAEAGDHR